MEYRVGDVLVLQKGYDKSCLSGFSEGEPVKVMEIMHDAYQVINMAGVIGYLFFGEGYSKFGGDA